MALKLTENEKQILNSISLLISEQGDMVFFGDLENEGFDTKKLRGVLSSLVKKNLIYIDNDNGGLISLLSAGEGDLMAKSIDRQKTKQALEAEILKVRRHSRLLDSDGDIDDMGACEYIEELNSVVEVIVIGLSDAEILDAAANVGAESKIVYEGEDNSYLTVGELIEQLKQYPEDMGVIIVTADNDGVASMESASSLCVNGDAVQINGDFFADKVLRGEE